MEKALVSYQPRVLIGPLIIPMIIINLILLSNALYLEELYRKIRKNNPI